MVRCPNSNKGAVHKVAVRDIPGYPGVWVPCHKIVVMDLLSLKLGIISRWPAGCSLDETQ